MLGSAIVLAALFGSDVFASILPIDPQCELNKLTFDKCLVNFFTKNIPTLATIGVPEASIPPTDPFRVPSLKLSFNNKFLTGSMVARKITLKGLGGAQNLKIETNIGKPSSKYDVINLKIEVFYPSLSITGRFEKSNVVALKHAVSETGSYKLDIEKVAVKISAKGKLLKHNETAYYPQLDEVHLDKLDVGDVKISASQVVKDNPKLSKQVIAMANSAWRTLYNEMKGQVKTIVERESVKFINKYLKLSGLALPATYVEKFKQG